MCATTMCQTFKETHPCGESENGYGHEMEEYDGRYEKGDLVCIDCHLTINKYDKVDGCFVPLLQDTAH